LPYRVSELWIVRRQKIEIYKFQDERYILVEQSQFFPGFDLNAIFTDCISDAYQFGSAAIDKLIERYPRQR
jgi:hypothetical protein